MSRSKAWYSYYPSDIEADTRDLTLEEFGAYQRLLNHHFLRDSVPGDIKRIALILGVTTQKARKLWSVLSCFFHQKDGAFYQKRMVNEITKGIEKSKKLAASGRLGGLAKAKAKAKAKAVAIPQPQPHKDIKEGADAPEADKEIDLKKQAFDKWVSVCQASGVKESSARSFLGKQFATYPEGAVVAAVVETCREARANPTEYLAKLLKVNPKRGRKADWEFVPKDDSQLAAWASKHGFPPPKTHSNAATYDQYRQFLWGCVRTRQAREAA